MSDSWFNPRRMMMLVSTYAYFGYVSPQLWNAAVKAFNTEDPHLIEDVVRTVSVIVKGLAKYAGGMERLSVLVQSRDVLKLRGPYFDLPEVEELRQNMDATLLTQTQQVTKSVSISQFMTNLDKNPRGN